MCRVLSTAHMNHLPSYSPGPMEVAAPLTGVKSCCAHLNLRGAKRPEFHSWFCLRLSVWLDKSLLPLWVSGPFLYDRDNHTCVPSFVRFLCLELELSKPKLVLFCAYVQHLVLAGTLGSTVIQIISMKQSVFSQDPKVCTYLLMNCNCLGHSKHSTKHHSLAIFH